MTRMISTTVLSLVAAVALAAPNAKADSFGFRIDSGHRPEMRRVWIEPVYEVRTNRVWVEPVYNTVNEPVFVNGYWKDVCDRVFVQPVFEFREVVRFDHCGRRIVTRERVCVREGGWQDVTRREWVAPHYRHENRQVVVTPGHFETCTQRVCVREGHWEMVPVNDHCRDGVAFRVNVGL